MRTIAEGMLEYSRCPQCGTEIQADSRFTQWCPACDWQSDDRLSAASTSSRAPFPAETGPSGMPGTRSGDAT